MANPALGPNRNIVARRVAIKPRVEARTTEIDCSQFAKLVELQKETVVPTDLDAEIEVVASLADTSTPSTPRFAHTLPREVPPPSPRATMQMPATAVEALTMEPVMPTPLATDAPEPMFTSASAYDLDEPFEIPRSRGWIVFAGVSVAMAVVALIAVLRI